MIARGVFRWILGLLYAAAGIVHLAAPEPFLGIMPGWVGQAGAVVFWTGVAELMGAIALLQQWSVKLRHAGAIGLALYAVMVFPANINHFALDVARTDGGLGLLYHIPRMFAQPLLVWLALWTGGVLDWPFRRR